MELDLNDVPVKKKKKVCLIYRQVNSVSDAIYLQKVNSRITPLIVSPIINLNRRK